MADSLEITIGPVLFDWPKKKLLRFYDEVAASDVGRVYIGEVVCSKRRGLSLDDISKVAEKLTASGKKVVLSTLAVVSNEAELDFIRGLVKLPFAIEANDASALSIASDAGSEIVAGPHILTYNSDDMDFLGSVGVERVVYPLELSAKSVAFNTAASGLETEVFAHGKAPLAYSWRCYSARNEGNSREDCRFECSSDPDGIVIKTLDEEPIFTLNGTSILSADTHTLAGHVEELAEMGVTALRLSPQEKGISEIIDIFKRRIDGTLTGAQGLEEALSLSPNKLIDGWYSGLAGKHSSEALKALSGSVERI